MWCCCRPRKITEALDECILNLKADPTIYKDVSSHIDSEDEDEMIQEFHAIPTVPSTIMVRVFDTTKEINFKETIPFYIRNILTSALEDFMKSINSEYNISSMVNFGGENEYGLLICVKESTPISFPPELLNYLLSNSFNITVNEQGLKFDFIFDQIEK